MAPKRNGYALLLTLWMLLIIASIASVIGLIAYRQASAVGLAANDVQQRYAMESALNEVLMERLENGRRSGAYLLPALMNIEIDGKTFEVSLRDHFAVLSLSTAPLLDVRQLAREVGFEPAEVRVLADNVGRARRGAQSELTKAQLFRDVQNSPAQTCLLEKAELNTGLNRIADDLRPLTMGAPLRIEVKREGVARSFLVDPGGNVLRRFEHGFRC